MNLWIDANEPAPKSWVCKWVTAISAANGMTIIEQRLEDVDPVVLVSVNAEMADGFCAKLDKLGGVFEVIVHGGDMPPETARLIRKNHWDKKVMDSRTAEIIMVLKGNHNLAENLPDNTPEIGAYLTDLALYLSDDCWCPFSTYAKQPGLMSSVIQTAVTDYLKACYNPSFFVWEYFNAKRQWGDRYTDDQCWCIALMMCEVRDNGKYVNGFSDANTKHYIRKRQFLPSHPLQRL